MSADAASPEFIWGWFPALFIGFWCAIGLLLSRLGGWHDLAEVYRTRQEFQGEKMHWGSASMRWTTRYNRCLILGSDETGLYMAMSFLFRIGHPPLFIPWSDIAVSSEKMLFWTYARLRIARVPNVPILLTAKTARRLLANGPLRFEAA